MPADGGYARIYFGVIEDPKFADVWSSNERFGLWARLLLLAEMAYPNPAPVPRRCAPRILAHLVEVGLIDMVGEDHYRVHGLAAEREARSDPFRRAAQARWKRRNSGADASHKRSNASTSTSTSTREGKPKPKPPVSPTTLLTADQLDSWHDLSSKRWDAFKEAWFARGFKYAPNGRAEDSSSQRGIMWEIVDARPEDVGEWVREAPGKTPAEVVAYCLSKWHAIKDAVPPDPSPKDREDGSAESLREIMKRIGTK